MPMRFAELDDKTRAYMLKEFEAEEASGKPYRGTNLTTLGKASFPLLMREAILHGNEGTLINALKNHAYSEARGKSGKLINSEQEAGRLGLTEFNTWYVRGLAKRLMDEGEKECQVHRAAFPKQEPSRWPLREGDVYPPHLVYNGHRAKYHPYVNPTAFSIPDGPHCHHTIRRIPKKSAY